MKTQEFTVNNSMPLASRTAAFMERAIIKGRQVPLYVDAYNFIKAIQTGELSVVTSEGLKLLQAELDSKNAKVVELEAKVVELTAQIQLPLEPPKQ